MSKAKKSVQDKVKEEYPEFADSVQLLSLADLNGRLAQLAKDGESVQDSKEADDSLQQAIQTSSELGAPYQEAKKAIRLKTKYIIELTKERG